MSSAAVADLKTNCIFGLDNVDRSIASTARNRPHTYKTTANPECGRCIAEDPPRVEALFMVTPRLKERVNLFCQSLPHEYGGVLQQSKIGRLRFIWEGARRLRLKFSVIKHLKYLV